MSVENALKAIRSARSALGDGRCENTGCQGCEAEIIDARAYLDEAIAILSQDDDR